MGKVFCLGIRVHIDLRWRKKIIGKVCASNYIKGEQYLIKLASNMIIDVRDWHL